MLINFAETYLFKKHQNEQKHNASISEDLSEDEDEPIEQKSDDIVIMTPTLTLKEILSLPAYPFYLAKTLIQIGYEPLPPYRSKSLLGFGSFRMYLPSVFTYIKYIYIVDGPMGLFRGLGCSLCTSLTYNVSKRSAIDYIEKDLTTQKPSFGHNTLIEVVAGCWAVLLSQPFYVITARTIAQFVGGEQKYSSFNIFQNIAVIYNEDGIEGFFSGFVPRLALEVSTVVLFNCFLETGRKLLVRKETNENVDNFVSLLSRMLTNSITYPLSLISTVCAVNKSGLEAGRPPLMPSYNDWMEIYRDLAGRRQLTRGSHLFIRPLNVHEKKINVN